MAMPVVTVASGGLPVVDVTATTPKFGLPISEAAAGRGTAVTKVASGGLAVTYSGGGGGGTTSVTVDAIATQNHAASAQSISLSMTVGASANAMLIMMDFGYSGHATFAVTWTVGGTVQTLVAGTTFDLILTSDNGAASPAIALAGLLNPTPGAGTLAMSFSSAADNLVMGAMTFNNVNTRASLSGAFAAAIFTAATSAAATLSMPAVPGGIQVVNACGIKSAGTPTGWAAGPTSIYVDSVTNTWGASAYQSATAANTFTQNISASELWAVAGVVVNPPAALPASATIDVSNTIASGLTAAIPIYGNSTLTDLVSLKTATPVGCSTDTSGGYGGGLAVPAASTTAKADFGVFQPVPNGNFTLLAFGNPASSGVNRGIMLGQADATPSGFLGPQSNSPLSNSQQAGTMAGGVFGTGGSQGSDDGGRGTSIAVPNGSYHVAKIDGGYHCWAMRVVGGVPSLWCDGARVNVSQVSVSGTFVNVSQHLAIGNLGNYTGAAFSAGCTVVLGLVWGRALTDAEMASVTANPFQVLH